MLMAPFAGDDLMDRINPVGAAWNAFWTLLCTPSSLYQDLGACWAPRPARPGSVSS
jgi:hypothetical protein